MARPQGPTPLAWRGCGRVGTHSLARSWCEYHHAAPTSHIITVVVARHLCRRTMFSTSRLSVRLFIPPACVCLFCRHPPRLPSSVVSFTHWLSGGRRRVGFAVRARTVLPGLGPRLPRRTREVFLRGGGGGPRPPAAVVGTFWPLLIRRLLSQVTTVFLLLPPLPSPLGIVVAICGLCGSGVAACWFCRASADRFTMSGSAAPSATLGRDSRRGGVGGPRPPMAAARVWAANGHLQDGLLSGLRFPPHRRHQGGYHSGYGCAAAGRFCWASADLSTMSWSASPSAALGRGSLRGGAGGPWPPSAAEGLFGRCLISLYMSQGGLCLCRGWLLGWWGLEGLGVSRCSS